MKHPVIDTIERRRSTNFFDPDKELAADLVEELVRLATRAPTAFNLQNWRFVAAGTPEAKLRLKAAAYGQSKVAEAAVTFIVCGRFPDHAEMEARLTPSVEAGIVPADLIPEWSSAVAATYGDNSQMQRDEAIRSATLGAAFLMLAAEAKGLSSCPMVGFDPHAVSTEFELGADEIPVLLLAVGHERGGNWPQKLRRPVSAVLQQV